MNQKTVVIFKKDPQNHNEVIALCRMKYVIGKVILLVMLMLDNIAPLVTSILSNAEPQRKRSINRY